MAGHSQDTIAAIATPIGEGGISVIRISGPEAISVAAKGFRGKEKLDSVKTHTAHHGQLYSPAGDLLDDVVALVFRAPHSYTGENTVEISCHGGPYTTRRILEGVLEYGCRHAQPGEFTKRAFLNGKMDLAQAEAVADLIGSRSEQAQKASLQQLAGKLSGKVEELRQGLIQTCGMLELELDFAEEGYEFADKQKVRGQVTSAISQIDGLLVSYQQGRVLRDGVKIVLVGMPNVGKSSLLNALLEQNRAIVTDIPGTTRDTIEENLIIDGVLFRIVDTAGLREAVDRVEAEGVRRSKDEITSANVLILVLDASIEHKQEELELAKRLVKDLKTEPSSLLLVLNKMDLVRGKNGELDRLAGSLNTDGVLKISATTGQGLEALRKALVGTVMQGATRSGETAVTVTNARHYDSLHRSKARLAMALESIDKGQSGEFVAVDLRGGLDCLGEISGIVTTDDILNEIFSKFCIGK